MKIVKTLNEKLHFECFFHKRVRRISQEIFREANTYMINFIYICPFVCSLVCCRDTHIDRLDELAKLFFFHHTNLSKLYEGEKVKTNKIDLITQNIFSSAHYWHKFVMYRYIYFLSWFKAILP